MPTISPGPNPSSPFASWKVDHAGVRVEDIDTAITWYVETLDFRLVRRWSLGEKAFGWLSPAGSEGFIVELLGGFGTDNRISNEDLGSSIKLSFRSHLGFHVESVDDTIAGLTRRGVTIISEPHDLGEVSRRVAFFVDPWGNLFEAFETFSV
jgi:catechol 2,3-dioxygenase-like lactoylglutathione lyase family enzyme